MGKRRNIPNFGGGANINKLMKEAQKLQKQMAQAQDELSELVIENTAGGGMVSCKINGDHELLELKIDPDVLDPEDADIIEESIIACINGAYEKLDKERDSKLGGLGGQF